MNISTMRLRSNTKELYKTNVEYFWTPTSCIYDQQHYFLLNMDDDRYSIYLWSKLFSLS